MQPSEPVAPLSSFEERRRRVVELDLGDRLTLGDAGEPRDPTQYPGQCVDDVQRHRRQAAARAFLALGAPHAGLVMHAAGARIIRLDMENLADRAALDHLFHFARDLGIAAVMADAERQMRILDGFDCLLPGLDRQCQRLFDEHVLLRFRGSDDLRPMQRMRRREEDRVDLGIGERVLVARKALAAELRLEGGGFLIDQGAAADDLDEILQRERILGEFHSPPAGADIGKALHLLVSRLRRSFTRSSGTTKAAVLQASEGLATMRQV